MLVTLFIISRKKNTYFYVVQEKHEKRKTQLIRKYDKKFLFSL